MRVPSVLNAALRPQDTLLRAGARADTVAAGDSGGGDATAATAGGGAVAAAIPRKRAASAAPPDPPTCHRHGGADACDDQEPRLARVVARLERRLERVPLLAQDVSDARIAELEEEAEQHREFGIQAGYEDCGRRARSVVRLYPKSATARDAINALAGGFDRLAVSSGDEATGLRARQLMRRSRSALP